MTDYTDSAMADRFENFFKHFKVNGDYTYVNDIDSLIAQPHHVSIDYNDFTDDIKKDILIGQTDNRVQKVMFKAICQVFRQRNSIDSAIQADIIKFELLNWKGYEGTIFGNPKTSGVDIISPPDIEVLNDTVENCVNKLFNYNSTGVFNNYKYDEIISSLKPTSTFTLDITPTVISKMFLDTGKKFYDIVKQALILSLEESHQKVDVETVYSGLNIEFTGIPTINMYDIKARKHENKMVTFDTTVIALDSPKSYTKSATAICTICGMDKTIKCTNERKMPPAKCDNPACKRAGMTIDPDTIVTDDIQTIVMQEPMELAKNNSPVILIGKLLGTKVGSSFAGQKKRITGLFKSVIDPKKIENDIYIEVASVESLEGTDTVYPTNDELCKIIDDSKEEGFLDKVSASFAPHIYGYKTIKLSVLLGLVGGNTTSMKRGNTHMLLVGDPSMAKSELLKFANKVTQKSMYTSGRGATAAGLTIGMVKLSDNRMVAMAGVLPLCSGGHAFIDEFDKMNPDDRSGLHEAMEQQTVSIAKAGIQMSLPSKTTIISAANPKSGKYDLNMPISDNLEVPPPLISRFDLIWLFTDKVHRDDDRRKAMHIIKSFTDDAQAVDTYMSEEMLKKYLNHARDLHPKLTKEVEKNIADLYEKMRHIGGDEDENNLTIGLRQLESIIRLSTAHAKLLLKEQVDISDVNAVRDIVSESYDSFGYDLKKGEVNQDLLFASSSKDTKDMRARHIWYKVADKDGSVDMTKFMKKLSDDSMFSGTKAQSWFGLWETNGVIKLNKNGTWRLS
tara:strand:+ start:736 stop:3102 length:2367 start_codon:yes stop_codon:yes gene_type:complete